MVAATRRGSSAAKTFVHDLLLAALSLLEPTCPDDLLAALQRHLYTMHYSQFSQHCLWSRYRLMYFGRTAFV